MANNYTEASFTIPCKDFVVTKQRMDAIQAFVRDDVPLEAPLFPAPAETQKRLTFDDGWNYLGFHWEVFPEGQLWFSHDESIDMERAVNVARLMLELDETDEICTAQWADICSKARIDEFGGGAVAFSRHGVEWLSTGEAARQCEASLMPAKPAFGLFDYTMAAKINRLLKVFGLTLKVRSNRKKWGDQVEVTVVR